MDIRRGVYRHYKDAQKEYEVLGVALATETHEAFVVYRPLYETEHEFFARPLALFQGDVDAPEFSYRGPRFVFVRDSV